MTIDYNSLLTLDQKINLIESRIQQFAAEAYQYELSLKTAKELGSEEQVEQILNLISSLEIAIRVHQEELKLLT